MKSKRLLLMLTSFCTLLGVTSLSSIMVNAAESDTAVANVKDAISKLVEAHNYTIEVSTKIGPIDITYNMYFTENAFYDDFLGDEYGYVQVDDGVFYFDLYNRDFTASNLMKDDNGNLLTSIWEDNLVYGINKLRTNEFVNATGKTFSSAEKRVKNVFLNMFHVDFAYYQYVNPVEFSINDDINSLEFVFSLTTGTKYVGKIKNFGTTTIDTVNDYLDGGQSYHKNDDAISAIIDLFANYNYTRIIYDTNRDGYDKIAGYEIYDKNYFYTFFEDEYIIQGFGYEIGMVGIDKTYEAREANGKTYGPYEFHGSYYCFITEDEDGNQELSVMTSLPINTDPFVPNVYNYPTFLKMFDDTQYLDLAGGSSSQYYTSKSNCVLDFVNNFQMVDTLNEAGAVPTGVYVEYLPKGSATYAGTEGKPTVVFSLEVNYFGLLTTIDYIYTDFNTTKIDIITQENVDKIIENAIQSMIDRDAANEGKGD